MPRIDGSGIPRKVRPIFLLVEKANDFIASQRIFDFVNSLELLLLTAQESSPDFELKVGAYVFSDDKHLRHPNKLVSISNLNVFDLFDDNIVDLSDVLLQLDRDLSRSALLKNEVGFMIPLIILILDGGKTHSGIESVQKLKNNTWFKHSRKLVYILNKHESVDDVVLELTGTEEAVFNIDIDSMSDSMSILEHALRYIDDISGSIMANHSLTTQDSILSVDPISDTEWDDDKCDNGGWIDWDD